MKRRNRGTRNRTIILSKQTKATCLQTVVRSQLTFYFVLAMSAMRYRDFWRNKVQIPVAKQRHLLAYNLSINQSSLHHKDKIERQLVEGLEVLSKLDEKRLTNPLKEKVNILLGKIFDSSIQGFLDWEVEEKEVFSHVQLRYGNELDIPSVHSFIRSLPILIQASHSVDWPVWTLLDRMNNELKGVLLSI